MSIHPNLVVNKETFQITYYHLHPQVPVGDIEKMVTAVGFENIRAIRTGNGGFKIFGQHAKGQAALNHYMANPH